MMMGRSVLRPYAIRPIRYPQLQTEQFSLSNVREVDAEAKAESESSRESEKINSRQAKGAVAYCKTGTISRLVNLNQITNPVVGLTVSFTVTPDEERLLLLDEVEDSQVTSLVRRRSGEPFEVEDFPGGDSSFSPKLEIKDAGGLVKDEKLGPDPVYQRSLRPRKAVPVEIEDISSSGDSEQAVPPCSGRCTHEDLKPFFLAQFQKISNQISNQMGEMERNIRRGLGLPEGTIHNSRKRKGGDDHHGQTSSPDSIGLETQETNRKGKRKKTGVSASVGKIQSYSLRRGGGDDVSQEPRRNNPAAAHRETLAKNVSGKGLTARPFQNKPQQETRTPSSGNDEHPQQNDSDNARMPPTFGNVTDQQQQTPSNALILYRNPLCVQPRSYVLPPEVSVIIVSAVKPSTLHFEVEGGSPVAWEKTNPHIYRSVRSVRSFHSPRRGNLDSKAKVASTGSGNVAAPDYIIDTQFGLLLVYTSETS
ncbi:hypothetical protein Bca52824_022947 [Brassica carinata]|uniref:Uncharacterized protein n=1 Tax=Brassica carinata TaxID=52824 RepID=A0A8X7VHA8_BRACI|nr:hypothetical protein Bca52824_022947 [Brassica carinata]